MLVHPQTQRTNKLSWSEGGQKQRYVEAAVVVLETDEVGCTNRSGG